MLEVESKQILEAEPWSLSGYDTSNTTVAEQFCPPKATENKV